MATKKFKVGEPIVYPIQGVGVIKEIQKKEFRGKDVQYYIIHLRVSDMVVMVPQEKAKELGIRSIVSKEEAEEALKFIAKKYKPVAIDWKLRYQMNLDLLKGGSIIEIAQVVQGLYHRSKVKELPVQERKLYDNARRILTEEIAIAIGAEMEDIDKQVFISLESYDS